jgi:hypothetical protein
MPRWTLNIGLALTAYSLLSSCLTVSTTVRVGSGIAGKPEQCFEPLEKGPLDTGPDPGDHDSEEDHHK